MRENEFLKGINNQDPQAYKELYNTYYQSLVMYSMNFIAQQDIAEDLVQYLFVNMWNKRITFISYYSFRTYLYNSIRNSALNQLKHQDIEQRYIEHVLSDREQKAHEKEIFDEEIYRRLYHAIDQLPPKCREIFLLSMDGKKNEEIAQELHIAIETVKTQKKRAVKQIKEVTAHGFMLLLINYPHLFKF